MIQAPEQQTLLTNLPNYPKNTEYLAFSQMTKYITFTIFNSPTQHIYTHTHIVSHSKI